MERTELEKLLLTMLVDKVVEKAEVRVQEYTNKIMEAVEPIIGLEFPYVVVAMEHAAGVLREMMDSTQLEITEIIKKNMKTTATMTNVKTGEKIKGTYNPGEED